MKQQALYLERRMLQRYEASEPLRFVNVDGGTTSQAEESVKWLKSMGVTACKTAPGPYLRASTVVDGEVVWTHMPYSRSDANIMLGQYFNRAVAEVAEPNAPGEESMSCSSHSGRRSCCKIARLLMTHTKESSELVDGHFRWTSDGKEKQQKHYTGTLPLQVRLSVTIKF